MSLPERLMQVKSFRDPSLEAEGRAIYNSNKDLRNFANVISHPEFSEFFKKFFSTAEDCQSTIMILKTAEQIRDQYKAVTEQDIYGYQLVALLKRVLADPNSLADIVQGTMDFLRII